MQIIIPKQVEEILAGLRADGYEAFAVGGCVRDTLLGRVPGDWDITTSARPEQVKKVCGKTIDTGLQHGTVTVMREHVGYEITTYRIDGEYEDARHPKEVAFTSDLKEDLRRRDFTINAMAYSHETGIVDIFGGMKDLKEGVVRCVGNAVERFTEDALRILRAIRFSAQLNFTIEDETYASSVISLFAKAYSMAGAGMAPLLCIGLVWKERKGEKTEMSRCNSRITPWGARAGIVTGAVLSQLSFLGNNAVLIGLAASSVVIVAVSLLTKNVPVEPVFRSEGDEHPIPKMEK